MGIKEPAAQKCEKRYRLWMSVHEHVCVWVSVGVHGALRVRVGERVCVVLEGGYCPYECFKRSWLITLERRAFVLVR